MSDSKFWDKAHAAAAKATWAYLATADGMQPKVRVVHPAFEGERVWVATGRASGKARHVDKNPKVELFYQIGAEMVHLTVTGSAKFVPRRSASGTARFSTTIYRSSGPQGPRRQTLA
jgi:uncharacterized pyridoxamine 5'-phosphate oxidase family protein